MQYDFKNKIVLITGGGSGIGKSAAEAFLASGAKVIISGRDVKKLKQVEKELSKFGNVKYFRADVASEISVSSLTRAVLKKYSRIDILINCAGVYGPIGKFHENSLKEWKQALNINLLGTANMVHAVLPFMLKEKAGKIINLSGGGAVQAFPNFSAYATSKAAVVRFTENLSREYEDKNIQAYAIAPGAVNTTFLDKVLKAKMKAGKDFYEKSLEQKKSGGDSPFLAAELMLFLCSPKAKGLSGRLISAKWDAWQKLKPPGIRKLSKGSLFTLRRIDNKYFKEIRTSAPPHSRAGKARP